MDSKSMVTDMSVYLVVSGDREATVVGVFSNRTVMVSKIRHLLGGLYIKGLRVRIPVTPASIGTQMKNGYLKLYKEGTNEVSMRIWKLSVDSVNPQCTAVEPSYGSMF